MKTPLMKSAMSSDRRLLPAERFNEELPWVELSKGNPRTEQFETQLSTTRLPGTLFLVTVLIVVLTTGCGFGKNVWEDSPTPTPTASQPAKADDKRDQKLEQKPGDAELQKQIEQIASAAKGHVGVAAVVLETGESASLNFQDPFPMQSVYKLPIGMAVMKLVDAGKVRLEQKVSVTKTDFVRAGQHSPIRDENPNGAELTVSELLRFSISESDGTASDVLMNLAGGAEAVQAYLVELKISGMIVLNLEKEIGRDWETQYRNRSTPEAATALLRALQEGRAVSESSQAFLQKLLTESTPGPKRLKGLLPAGTMVAHKTGTSGARNGITAATNDIGIISLPNGKHVAIAVFVSDSPVDEAAREKVIARVARAVWDKWSVQK